MSPSELQSFIEQQARIGDRIARKAARVKQQLLADPVFKAPRYIKVLDRAIKAIDKPGLPPSSRPKGIDGAESFHFRLENVTKASLYSAAAGAGSLAADRVLAYMEREGAAETVERGEAQHVVAFAPRESFMGNLVRLLGEPPRPVTVSFLEPILHSEQEGRRGIATLARARIERAMAAA